MTGTQPETPHGHNLVQPQAEQSEAGDTERSRMQQPGISLANPDEPSSPAGKAHLPSLFAFLAHLGILMLADGLCLRLQWDLCIPAIPYVTVLLSIAYPVHSGGSMG